LSAVVFAIAALSVLSACGSTHAADASPPADSNEFYQPPSPLPRRPPGTLIRAARVPLPLHPPATVWRILYHSRSLAGKDIAVSGFAIVPPPAATGSRRPVYAWAHGSAGQADSCAPSHDVRDNLPPYGGLLVARGAALVATDYQGLGTAGDPTAYVGIAEGRAVLDSVRATRQLPGVGRLGPVLLAGQSQGGGAALWAAQLARTYAPGLDIRGVAALAPVAQLTTIMKNLGRAPFNQYLGEALWAVDGLDAGYPTLDLASRLTRAARADLARVVKECAAETIARWRGRPVSAAFAQSPLSIPAAVKVLNQNSPGATDPHVPIFLAQGSRDEQIPVAVTAELEARYCTVGATLIRRLYRGATHDSVIDAASKDVLFWIRDRIRNRPAPSDCSHRG
jgi:alpha-beta hydrolase superfamily lysophospholipase